MRVADDNYSVLIQGNEQELEVFADNLRYIAAGNKLTWNLSKEQRALFTSVSADITKALAEKREIQSFHIFAKGKRKLSLGFKREPTIYLGRGNGRDFLEACTDLLLIRPGYNSRNNTYRGHQLEGD